jgi:Ni,Fe-hydrogenase III component G
MGALTDIARHSGKVEALRRWPRATVTSDIWRRLTKELVDARATLLGLWGDASAVHMALIEEPSAEIAVFTLPCPDGKFPSVGAHHPPAIRLERTIRDLYGFKPVGLTDTRPWLDLGCWGVTQPLGAKKRARKAQEAYAFLPVEGEDLHQIPVGPVHAGIIEPGHFRFTANGETVARLEARLGYVHKGTESLMTGASIDKGARLAGRTSGDSTVAYALSFAHAVETALEIEVPPRAVWLRALMAELASRTARDRRRRC